MAPLSSFMQVAQGPAQRSRPPKPQQQQRPAVRKLQLGEEDSYSAAAEHYRPPAHGCSTGISTTAAEAISAESTKALAVGAGAYNSIHCMQKPAPYSSCWDGCHLPSLSTPQQQQPRAQLLQQAACSGHAAGAAMPSLKPIVDTQQQPCISSAPGINISADCYEQRSAHLFDDLCDEVECDNNSDTLSESDSEDSSLYAPRCDSRAGLSSGLLAGTGSSRSLLPSSSIGGSSSTANSAILALQQRLLPQAQPGLGRRSSGGGSSSCGSVLQGGSQAAAAAAAGSLRPLSGSGRPPGSAGLLMRGLGASGALGATAAPALHARMASTAARAQLLLTQELNSLVPPPAPRLRPESAGNAAAAASSAAVVGTVAAGVVGSSSGSVGQPPQQQWGPSQLSDSAAGAAPALLFLGSSSRCSSRPSSAARAGSSQAGSADAGGAARSSCVPGDAVGTLLYSPCSYSNPSNLSSSSGCCNTGGVVSSAAGNSMGSFSRRPVSAGVGGAAAAARCGSSSGSEGGSSSGRPSTSGSMLGAMASGGSKPVGLLALFDKASLSG